VDSYGTLKAVLHKGIKFLNKDERQQPSYIPVGTTLDDTIMPTENIFWDTYYLRWDVRPIVPTYVQEEKVDEIIDSFKNGTVSIILPIKVRDEIKEYRFDFKVELTKILD
jgi:hypothetical protein